ncbi:MAG: SufE family protein [Anaerolineales bacterium]|nr:SufE family protein [Anaerolineales bacterium]MCB8954462.1 SufE family protein [Ardenticatenales bacterium]
MSDLPARLAEIVEDFSDCQGREKLEYLLEFAERLPDVPARLHALQDDAHQVHECITPIWLYAEENAGKFHFYFDVPQESPTVRGFASIMQEGAQDLTREQLLAIPFDFYYQMGLQEVLSSQRLNGIGAILHHMKQQVTKTGAS